MFDEFYIAQIVLIWLGSVFLCCEDFGCVWRDLGRGVKWVMGRCKAIKHFCGCRGERCRLCRVVRRGFGLLWEGLYRWAETMRGKVVCWGRSVRFGGVSAEFLCGSTALGREMFCVGDCGEELWVQEW